MSFPVSPPNRRHRYDDRVSRSKRGYGRDWQRLRARKLVADPLCELHLKEGRLVEAVTVDHIVPIREQPELRLEWSNLRSLCQPCHDGLPHGFVQNPARRRGCDEHGWPLDAGHLWNR